MTFPEEILTVITEEEATSLDAELIEQNYKVRIRHARSIEKGIVSGIVYVRLKFSLVFSVDKLLFFRIEKKWIDADTLTTVL